MCERYIIEIELTLAEDAVMAALEQARQLCLSHGRFRAVGQDGKQVSEEEFIDVCVAKLASAPEIRDFRADAAVRQGDVTPTFRD